MGKIKRSRIGVNQYSKSSFRIPNQKQKGFDNQAEVEPVIAKTINMIASCKFDLIPQRSLKVSIFIQMITNVEHYLIGT